MILKILGCLYYRLNKFQPRTDLYPMLDELKCSDKSVKFLGLGESNQVWWGKAFQNNFKKTEYENLLALPGENIQVLYNNLIKIDVSDMMNADKIVIMINEGINDALDGTATSDFLYYHIKIINHLKNIWVSKLKNSLKDFYVIFFPAHPINWPDNRYLRGYREGFEAANSKNRLFINMMDYTNYFELKQERLYSSDKDTLHLNERGYETLVKRIFGSGW